MPLTKPSSFVIGRPSRFSPELVLWAHRAANNLPTDKSAAPNNGNGICIFPRPGLDPLTLSGVGPKCMTA